MARAYFGDVAIYTIGGADQLGTVDKIEWTNNVDTQEGGAIPFVGESPQVVKLGAKLNSTHMSNVTGVGRVTNLDVSALSLGGVAYANDLVGGSFDARFTHSLDDANKDVYAAPSVTNKAYSGTVKLLVPAASAQAIVGAFHPANLAGLTSLKFVFSITVNGVTITLPVLGKSIKLMADYGKNQELEVGWEGQHQQVAGAYPTVPTGTSSLLEKALNDYRTALAYVFKTHGTNGHQLSGNMVWDSYSFSFDNRSVIKSSMAWQTSGTPTYTQIGS